jgi:hypothetical protein
MQFSAARWDARVTDNFAVFFQLDWSQDLFDDAPNAIASSAWLWTLPIVPPSAAAQELTRR